eukprot:118497_1
MGTCVSGCNGSTDGHEDKEAQNRSKYKSQHDAKHICEEALSGSSERIPLHTNLNKLDLSSASNPDDATVTNDDRKATDSSMEDQKDYGYELLQMHKCRSMERIITERSDSMEEGLPYDDDSYRQVNAPLHVDMIESDTSHESTSHLAMIEDDQMLVILDDDDNCDQSIELKEDVVLDTMLSEVLETQKTDPDKIDQMNADGVVNQQENVSDSYDSDHIQMHQTLMGFATKKKENMDGFERNDEQSEGEEKMHQHETLMGLAKDTENCNDGIDHHTLMGFATNETELTNDHDQHAKSDVENEKGLRENETLMGLSKEDDSDNESQNENAHITMIGEVNNDEKIKFSGV